MALLPDFPEEGWPSMDLCAEMLEQHFPNTTTDLKVFPVRPPFRRRFGRLPGVGPYATCRNADRFLARYYDFPRFLRRCASQFDLFHIVDHSYAHLVLELPPERTGVYCHDLDAFRCLLGPRPEPRPRWFRAIMARVLRGFERAAVIFHTTDQVGQEILEHGLADASRLVYAPNGIAPEYTPQPANVEKPIDHPFILHVGSCVPRKRIDVLLAVFAGLRTTHPALQLIQVGGEWTAPLQAQITRLGLASSVQQLRGISRSQLAGLYQQAAVVLQPSEAEGFGLPVVEALACGAIVVASDIPVLREVGGAAAVYCPVGDVSAWADTVSRLLDHPTSAPDRAARLAWASRFSWAEQARTIASAYRRLLDAAPSESPS
jgi:glycosyltransferase involved in cell wall biosynthesis